MWCWMSPMSRARRSGLSWVLLSILSLSTLTACAGDASAEDSRITFWAVNMGPTLEENQQLLDRELAEFTDETGIEVDLEVIAWPDLYTRLMTAVGSGQGPDVVNIGNTWSATLQDTGALLAFDDEAMEAIGGADKFVDVTLTATGAAGKPPASIPYLGQAFGLFYNTELFAEAGIDSPPTTWAELVADAKRLTGPGRWGLSLSAASATGNAQLAFILGRQEGAELFGPDGQPQLDAPEAQAAVRRLVDLMARDRVVNPSDAEQSGVTDALAALADGRAAMVPYQSSGRGYLASVGFDDYAVAPLPVLDPLPAGGVPVSSFVAGTNLAVLAKTEHPDLAIELVRFLTSEDEQATLNAAFKTLPVVESAYADPAFTDPATQMFGTILQNHSESVPMVPGEGQMEQLLGGAISQLWAKVATGGNVTDEDIAAALRDADRQMPD